VLASRDDHRNSARFYTLTAVVGSYTGLWFVTLAIGTQYPPLPPRLVSIAPAAARLATNEHKIGDHVIEGTVAEDVGGRPTLAVGEAALPPKKVKVA
jgi:hypothetical protein